MKRLFGLLLVGIVVALSGGVASADGVAGPGWAASESFAFDALRDGIASDPVDAEEVADQIRAFEAEHEAAISTPAAVAEREASVDAFANLGAGAAIDLITDVFAEQLDVLTTLPTDALLASESAPRFRRGADFSARVDPPGPEDSVLVVSNVPLRNGDGEVPSGELKETEDGFVPEVALADVLIPANASGRVELGDVEVAFGFEGAAHAEGRLVDAASGPGGEMVLYPNTHTDTDTAVTYTLSGVETFNYLRSAESPESLALDYVLPQGARVEANDDGGVIMVDSAGDVLITMFPPYAVDAQGTDVPMSLSVADHRVVLDVPHRDKDFAYPIMVDPVQHVRDWWANGNSPGFEGWSFYQSGTTNYSSNLACPPSVAAIESCGGSGAGLYVNAVPTRTYPANSKGYWRWAAPGGSSSSIISATISSWRYRKGNSNPGNAFYKLWDSPSGHVFTTGGGGGGLTLTGANSGVKYIDMGLSTTTANTMPGGASNWRYARLAGYTANLTDGEAPSLNLDGAPAGWLGPDTNFTVNANASDPGLGLAGISAYVNNNWLVKWFGWCDGTYPFVCTRSPVNRALSFNSSSFPSGINSVAVKAIDAVSGTGHETQRNFTVKVDRVKPLVELAGDVDDGDWSRADTQSFDILAEDAHSGIKSVAVTLDGQLVEREDQSCPTSECDMSRSFDVDLSTASPGIHQIKFVATDHADNSTEEEINVNIDSDVPTVDLNSDLLEADLDDLADRVYEIEIVGSDSGGHQSGIENITVLVDDQPIFNRDLVCVPTCPENVTSIAEYDATEWDEASHSVHVMVADRAGNHYRKTFEINQPLTQLDPASCAKNPSSVVVNDPAAVPSVISSLSNNFPALLAPVFGTTVDEHSGKTLAPSLIDETQNADRVSFDNSKREGHFNVGDDLSLSVGDTVCLSPTTLNVGHDVPTMIESVSASDTRIEATIVANSERDADTVLRPTVMGGIIATHIRSDAAPTTFAYNLRVPSGSSVKEIAGGRIAVTVPAEGFSHVDQRDSNVEMMPNNDPDGSTFRPLLDELVNVPDVGKQTELAEWQFSSAAAENPERVVIAVIDAPEAVDANGIAVPTSLALDGDQVRLSVNHEHGDVSYPVLARASVDVAISAGENVLEQETDGNARVYPIYVGCNVHSATPTMIYRHRNATGVYKVRWIGWGGSMKCNAIAYVMRLTGWLQRKGKLGVLTTWSDKGSFQHTRNNVKGLAVSETTVCRKPWNGSKYINYRTKIVGTGGFSCRKTGGCNISLKAWSPETKTKCSN